MIAFNQSIGRFSFVLFFSLLISFGCHFCYLHFYVPGYAINDIVITYVIHFFLGLAITYGLYRLKEKYAHSLGFVFMGGSMFKFLIFFLAIQPIYKADGQVSALEFGYFFIPYTLSLVFETLFISQILNTSDFSD
ncbi:MAG: hypothetical protein ACI9GM_000100 [Salibacteraceae bacterium]|jgi:hypothetical protein